MLTNLLHVKREKIKNYPIDVSLNECHFNVAAFEKYEF